MLPITLTGPVRSLVVGGGNVALRKVRWLLACSIADLQEPEIDLLTPELCAELRAESVAHEGLRWKPAPYHRHDLTTYRLVFACTDNPEKNRQIAADAREDGCMVNVADAPELCDFFVPATVRRKSLCVAFSAGGAPALSAALRAEAEALYPAALGELAARIRHLREELQTSLPDAPQQRVNILRRICSAVVRTAWLNAPTPQEREALIQQIIIGAGQP